MANTDKNIIITPNIGSSTADPNIVFTGGNSTVANSINMTMYASGTLSWDGTAGQLFSITNSLTGTIFSVNDISGIPSITVNSLGNIVLAQYSGNVTVGAAQGQAGNVLSVAGNLYTSGNSYVAQNQYVTGNIVAYGSNDLFSGKVGIGTSSVTGANSNVLAVYGTAMQYGNLVIQNQAAGGSGIYFADGTFLSTANGGSGNYSNTNVASYLSGPVQVGNLTINNTTASTSTLTGALLMGGGAGIQGAVHVGGLIYGASTLNIAGAAQVNSLNSNTNIVATNLQSTGQTTVASLVSNGTITGTVATVTSLQNSGTTTTNAVVSNVYGLFGQNVTVNSTNASTTTGTGALILAGGAGIGGNINVGGANSLFTNKVGIGTSVVLGARGNVLSVYGSINQYGNLVIVNATAGNSGIYFADGTFQQTASTIGGVNQSVQFNDNGVFGGQADFIFDKVNDRLGIGTTSVTNSLTVFGTTPALFSTTNGADQQIIVGNSNTSSYGTVIGFNSSSGTGLNTYGYLSAVGAAAKNIAVTKTGTGIGGVTIPQNTLEIGGTTIIGGTFSGNNNFINPPSNGLAVQGSVGVGTFTPLSTLDVNGIASVRSALSVAGTATVSAVISNTNITTATLNSTGAALVASLNSNTNVVGVNLQSTGQATVASLVANANIFGATLNTSGAAQHASIISNTNTTTATLNSTGALQAASINSNTNVVGVNLQSTGQATVASLVSNGAVSGTTGTFTGSLYGGTVNSAGAAIVASLNSNTNVVATNIQSTGQATVASLVSNGAVSGTTGTFTGSLYGGTVNSAGAAIVNSLNSNTNVVATNIQSTGQATVASLVSNGAVSGTTGTFTGSLYGGTVNSAGAAIVASLNSNTNVVATNIQSTGQATVASLVSNGAVSGTTGTFTGSLYGGTVNSAGAAIVNSLNSNTNVVATNIQSTGQASVASLVANANIFGATLNTSGAAQHASIISNNNTTSGTLNVIGAAQVSSLISNNNTTSGTLNVIGAAQVSSLISNTTIYSANLNIGSNVIVGSLNSNTNVVATNIQSTGQASLASAIVNANITTTTLNSTGALQAASINSNTNVVGVNLQSTGQATVASLVSNAGITATTITGTAGTFTSLQNSGTTLVQSLNSNTNVVATNIQSTGQATVASLIANANIFSATLNTSGAAQHASIISNTNTTTATLNSTGALQAASINSNTNVVATNLQSTGQATVASLVSNGAVSGTAGTFTGSLYGATVNSAGTAIVNALISNTDVKTATVNATSTIVGANIYSNGFVQAAGTVTAQSVFSNTTVTAGTGLTVTSGGISVTGVSSFTGNVNVTGNINVSGAINSTVSNILVIESPIVYVGEDNPGDTYDLGLVGSYTEGSYFHTGLVRNHVTNYWTIFDKLSSEPNVITGNIDWSDSTLVYGPFAAGNVLVVGNTASTGTTTGAIVINGTGGVGVGGRLNVGAAAWFASTLNAGGAAIVNSLVSNGAVSGTTGTFGASLQSGAATVASLNSNTNVVGVNVQSTGQATVASLVSNGAVSGTTGTFGAGLQSGAATVASLNSNTNVVATNIQSTGQASVASLVSNGAVSGTTGTFGAGLQSGAATVASLTSNGAITGTVATVTSLQNSGTTTTNALISNVYGLFGQNVTVNSTNASTTTSTGALILAGGAGIGGNINVGGANSLFTNKVGVGTSVVLGARGNVLSVYGSINQYGNLVISNTVAGGSGIYFPDGTYQTTASTATSLVAGVNQSIQFNDSGVFGGVTNFLFDKVNSRLGIGTTSLTNTLSVFGTTPALFSTTNGADQQIIVGNSNTNSYGTVIGYNSSSGTGANTYGYVSAVGAASKNISVTATGTGIGGVTIPQNTLEVGGTTIIGFTFSGNNSFINPPSNGLAVQGSVGVGTFTPMSTLDVNGIASVRSALSVAGTATVSALIANNNVFGATLNTSGLAQHSALIINTNITTSTLNSTGAALVASLNSNTNVVGVNLQSTGQATVASLVANANIFGATLNTSGAAQHASLIINANTTSSTLNIQNGAVVNALNSNTNVVATNIQSTGQATVASLVANANIFGATLNTSGAAQHASLIVNANTTSSTLNIQNGAVVNALNSNTNVVGVNLQSTGQATVASLVSNGAVSGTTGTFTGALYGGSFNTAGTATVNALTSNGAIAGTTINGTAGTFTSLQNSGTTTTNALVSNVYGLFGQNVTVNSTNASTSTTTGALVLAGGAGIAGNINVGGTRSLFTGAVGIATTTTTRPLDVNGTIRIADGAALEWGGTTASISGTSASNTLFFTTSSTERMRISAAGNVMIGTTVTTPAGLAVVSNINNSTYPLTTLDASSITIRNDSVAGLNLSAKLNFNVASVGASVISGYYAAFNASNDIGTGLIFGTQTNAAGGTVERMRVDSYGNVGIGYTTPLAKLDVNGTVRYVSTNLSGVSAGPTLNYNWLQTNGVLQSYKIATLPASTGSTFEHLLIEGVLGTWTGANKYAVKLVASNRQGLNVKYLEGAAYGQSAHIDFYTEADTSVSVWVVLDATTFCTASVNITVAYGNPGGLVTYPAPVNSTPTGTLTYSTSTATPDVSYGSNLLVGVGIGTTASFSTLDVNGNAGIRGTISASGAAIVASLTSNGAVSGTTGTFTGSLYGGTVNSAGTATVNALVGNVYGLFGQNVTVNSTNASTSTTTGALLLAGGAGIAGNINVGGANNLFTNKVGIGTSTVLGARSNVLAVYGSTDIYGNIELNATSAGSVGIYFADGTYQTTAASAGGTGNYSNTNVASYLSGPVQVGNLTINNTTASTSTLTGALLMGGGAGIQGAVHVGGLIYGASTLNIAGAAQVNSMISNTNIFSATMNTSGAAQHASMIVNANITTATLNSTGAAIVSSLTSNGAITGTTGAFSTSLYSATFNTAGTATVNALVSNGTITGTTLIGPAAATSSYLRITNPGGAEYATVTASVTGAIQITLPVGYTSTMISMTVKVFDYALNESFEIHVGGYNYSVTPAWINPFAYIVGNPGIDSRYTVRFGFTAGGKTCIYIGELATVWSYPQITVTDVQLGFGGYSATWATGWAIGFQAVAFETVTATIINSQVGYGTSTNTVNALVLRDASGNFSAGTGTFTGLQNSGTTTTNALVSNVYGLFGQNVIVNSANASTSTTTGAFEVVGGAGIGGNINAGGSRSLFTGAIGVGTTTAAGMIAAAGVSNDAYIWGNVRIANTAATSSGIVFSDGTRQTTAGTNTPSFGITGTIQLAGVSNTFTGDTDTFFYDTTNNRLGLGTSTPGQTLSVYSAEGVLFNTRPGGAARQEITVGNTGTQGAVLGYDPTVANSIGYLRRGDGVSTTPAIAWAYGTGAYRIGINGITQPQNTLDVSGTVAIGLGYSGFAAMTNTNGLSVQGAVGVGTFTPSTSNNNMTVYGPTGGGIQLASGGVAGGGNIQANTGGGLKFSSYTGGVGAETYTNRMIIDAGGQVGIGLTDALSAFDVNGISSFRSAISVASTATVNTLVSNVYGLFGQNVTVNSTNVSISTTTGALVVAGGIGAAGNVVVGGNIITTGTSGNISGVNNISTVSLTASGNINVGGANNLFTNKVGIGTSAVLGARGNILSTYGSINQFGNLVIGNTTAGGSGIYFADGTFMNTAGGAYTTFNYTGNGATTSFSTSPITAGSVNNTMIFVNGVYQRKSTYTWTGTNILFSSAPPNFATIEINCIQAVNNPLGIGDLTVTGNSTLTGNVTIHGAQVDGYDLTVVGGTLGTAASSQVALQTYFTNSANGDQLQISNMRNATGGADWTTAGYRLQQKVDATWMGFVQFNNGGSTVNNSGGLSFGTGQSTVGPQSIAERMRIDNNGGVAIGQTSVTAGYILDVNGSIRSTATIVALGEITAYFSDKRLKTNITAITNAVDKVMKINGVYYNANQLAADIAGADTTVQQIGLLAQEVEAVLPHIVRPAPFDIGDNGTSKSGENYKTLQYEKVVPLLVEAIKEQQGQIELLTSRIAVLEGLINK